MLAMPNPDREYDKTHLSIDTAEERILVHRDYLAHCLRWSHVVKCLYQNHRYKNARILDVGCGREMPLAKLLYANRMTGAKYCGVDMNALSLPDMVATAAANEKLEVHVKGQMDASKLTLESTAPPDRRLPWSPNIIVCFEVFEHMHPRIARALLKTLRNVIAPGGTMFFSTPNWNGDAAANHINETKYQALAAILAETGWKVERNYGTFASQRDYIHEMLPEEQLIFRKLSEYYDSNLLSIMLAPLYPELSRNALWVLSPGVEDKGLLERIEGPWCQHPDWRELA
jgi:2-polyprenyl-3-methyl-5-hydroxy-6-metoxy-1,4-benzoquinol methylase